VVIKDNLTFGIRETKSAFEQNAGYEEDFLTREGRMAKDKRCEFWMEFENGLKLMVEMQNELKTDYDKWPPLKPEPEVEVEIEVIE